MLFAAAAALMMVTVSAQTTPPCSLYDPSHKLETPCFALLSNATRYQLRVYGTPVGQSWSTASVNAADYAGATQKGFGLNFAYISGDNAPHKKIPMTAPVATRNPGGNNWLVSFFTPQCVNAHLRCARNCDLKPNPTARPRP